MSAPFINSILSYLRGDGAVILPQMELTLFGLAILIMGSSIDESAEENWFTRLLFKDFFAKAAFAGTVFGAFSSGILAYGFSILYGLTGTTNTGNIQAAFDQRSSLGKIIEMSRQPGMMGGQARQVLEMRYPAALHLEPTLLNHAALLAAAAFVLVAVGLFFKIAAVPFHQWAPDVYEGAPTPVTAYVSVASKTASLALLLRLFTTVFAPSHQTWIYLVACIAVASLTWGNLAALTQTNVKRLLAYSSISHVGYILLGLLSWDEATGTLTKAASTGI